jgi:hypothetical protein
MGRSLLDSVGAAPSVRNYDIKKEKLLLSYTQQVDQMVRTNGGIVTWDNYCHAFGSPSLASSRDSSYIKANYTVAALCAYEFKKRPSFLWAMIDEKVALASIPRDIDLEPFKDEVVTLFGTLICVHT